MDSSADGPSRLFKGSCPTSLPHQLDGGLALAAGGLLGICLALSFHLASPLSASPTGEADEVGETVSLPPWAAVEKSLEQGESHRYRLLVTSNHRWVVRLDQLGVDASLQVHWPEAETPLQVDSPLDRDGIELLVLPLEAVEGVELTVRGLLPPRDGGKYRLQLLLLDDAPGDVLEDSTIQLDAFTSMTAAGRGYARGGREGRLQALEHYRQAVELWRQARRPRLAAQSLYCVAVLHRLMGDQGEGLTAAQQVLPLWQALGDLGREADTWNEIGLLQSSQGHAVDARAAFTTALRVQQSAGDLLRQAATVNNLCLTHLVAAEFRQALDCYGPALVAIRAAEDDENEAVALTNLGWVWRNLGQPDEALQSFEEAARIHRQAGREKRHAETLNSLAILHRQLDEPLAALNLYLQVLEIFERLGHQAWQAAVLHNLGVVYQSLGDGDRASAFYHRSLDLKRQLGNVRGEASTLRRLGLLALNDGQPAAAKETLQRALELELSAQNRRGEAMARRLLGRSLAERGQHRQALDLFDQALETAFQLEDRRQEALTQLRRGQSLLALGRLDEARHDLDAANQQFGALGWDLGVSETLLRLAEIERADGHLDVALAQVDQAIEGFESLRAKVWEPELRSTFSGLMGDLYGLRIELLISLDAIRPDDDWLHLAFETSERVHARGLVDRLTTADDTGLDLAEPELRAEIRTVRRRLHLEAEGLRKLLARKTSDAASDEESAEEAAKVETQFLQTLAEVEQLQAQARQGDRGPRLEEPEPSTSQIQGLLDGRTALLEYSLGEERSFLFLLTQKTLKVFELPPQKILEDAARRVHQAWATQQASPGEASQLAGWLWPAALNELDVDRLVIVADGALHYLSFAALALPSKAGDGLSELLLKRFELVSLPSASTLAAERQRRAGRPPARRWAAIVADPVFAAQDPRLAASASSARISTQVSTQASTQVSTQASQQGIAAQELPRLRRSRREAEQIAAWAPADEVFVALDFDASRSLVVDGALADFRIVHFATHGLIDERYPALSGLALSQFDAAGRPVDGFLDLGDIEDLALQADLVVLSACRSALGKEVRGEGLLGLTRGFLRAGASRVVASLWSVPDAATAELMERFYAALVRNRLPPAAALRQAQLSMLDQRRWRAPYNWAGFVLIGDWRSEPLFSQR